VIFAILDHLWQSTLFALAAGLLALAFGKAGAAVRYGLWLVASAKFLVPFAVLAVIGRLLAPVGPPPAAAAAEAAIIAQAAQPFSQPHAAPIHISPAFDPAFVLLAVWAIGCAGVLGVWAIRWRTVREILRSARPLAWAAPMPVVTSASLMEPGLVGLWRPVLLIPESLPDHLGQAEIDALLAHETAHFRRRDNLTAAAHMLVEALFWFHPLVWWIGARLIEERERACDEAVVRAGHDRTAYARSLVESCRLYLQSPLSCVSGASGSSLETRVAMIMTSPLCRPLTASGKILLLAAGACALASPVAAGWLTSPAGQQAITHVSAAVSQAIPSGPDATAAAPRSITAAALVATPADGRVRPGRTTGIALSHDELVVTPPPATVARPALDRPHDQEVTMKPLVIASAISLIASASPAAAQVPASQPTDAADQKQVVCRKERVPSLEWSYVERQVCRTQAQWDARDRVLQSNSRGGRAVPPAPNPAGWLLGPPTTN
jgi:beta-lactamase regulating signal transducer with metallopeptidase domain